MGWGSGQRTVMAGVVLVAAAVEVAGAVRADLGLLGAGLAMLLGVGLFCVLRAVLDGALPPWPRAGWARTCRLHTAATFVAAFGLVSGGLFEVIVRLLWQPLGVTGATGAGSATYGALLALLILARGLLRARPHHPTRGGHTSGPPDETG